MNSDAERETKSRYTPPSPILWQNSDHTVTLLDIPHSISKAQEHNSNLQPLSSSPLLAPFPSNEPKSASARTKLAQNTIDAELHAEYAHLLALAIDQVRNSHDGSWCLPRPFCEKSTRQAKKRKVEHASGDVANTSSPVVAVEKAVCSSAPCVNDAESFFASESDETIHLQQPSTSNEAPRMILVPPRSSFYLGDCADADAFHAALRIQAQQTNSCKDFDFILLDPPWPNRSVKRTHQTPGSTYSTSPSLLDLRELILDMRLDSIMAADCLVGMWITNKAAVRELVLGADGIFPCWNVELVEEWIWLKTTVHGEPVTGLDSLWRKPYEVLLLGRKRRKASKDVAGPSPETNVASSQLKRRVIISVPDLHSRKPCLRELVEPLVRDSNNYRALEVFARHLVTGWWSWGNECTKFNEERYWRHASIVNGHDGIASTGNAT